MTFYGQLIICTRCAVTCQTDYPLTVAWALFLRLQVAIISAHAPAPR